MFAQGFKSTILNYFPSLKWLFVFVDWEEKTSGSWRWEKQRSLNTNQRTMRDEELYISLFSIFLQSFLKLWDEWMHPFHKISINLRLARNNTFCFCEQCLLYLSNFAGDHPLVQPAVQHERIKKSCQSWKYSPPAFIINMHWNWTFVKSLPNAEYLTWLKINMEINLAPATYSLSM